VIARVARRSVSQVQGVSNSIAGYIPLFDGNASRLNPASRPILSPMPRRWSPSSKTLTFSSMKKSYLRCRPSADSRGGRAEREAAERPLASQPLSFILLWRDDRGCDHVRCRLQRISHFVLPNAILRHCGVDIGKCDFFDAPHRGSRLEPRGTDLAIVFGRVDDTTGRHFLRNVQSN
jgi:hypothetical protein